MRRSLAIALALSLYAKEARADVDGQFAIWTAAFLQARFASVPRLQVWFDVHGRRAEPSATAILRPGLGLEVVKGLTLWVGYGWVPTFPDSGGRIDEH